MDEIKIALPFPPTVNHYWKFVRNKSNVSVFISKRGILYRQEVLHMTINHKKENKWELATPYFQDQRLTVAIGVYPPDKRKRDIDNILKSVLDAMTMARIYTDDSQIDHLIVDRGSVEKEGKLIVTIQPIR